VEQQDSLAILHRLRQLKQAAVVPSSERQAVGQSLIRAANQHLRQDAFRDALAAGLTGFALGAGGRGLTGLISQLRQKDPLSLDSSVEAPLPLPVVKRKKKKPDGSAADPEALQKTSSDEERLLASKYDIPWYAPAAATGATLGAALGWSGMNHFLKQRRKAMRKRQLQQARQRFFEESMAQYSEPVDIPNFDQPAVKQSADRVLDAALDRLYDQLQDTLGVLTKQAGSPDWAARALGAYGAYAGVSGVLGGLIAWNQMRKRSKTKIMEKAVKQKELEALSQSPPTVYAYPVPVERFDESE
jgi:hypothetical protein